MRIFALIAIIAVSALGAYAGEPYVRGNTDAILVLVTVFTVFAGFMVAIVAILGDPALLPPGSWRLAALRRESIETRIFAHVLLFTVYLITIGALFAGVVVYKQPATDVVSLTVKIWIGRAYLFIGSCSFLLTFALPRSLFAFQLARHDAEVERRRRLAGIQPEAPKTKTDT